MCKPPKGPFFFSAKKMACARRRRRRITYPSRSFFCADGFVGERLRWGHEGVRTGVETPNDPLPETNGLESRSEVSPRQGVGQRRRERMTRDTRMRREGSEMDLCTRATRLSCAHGKPSRLGASEKVRCAVSREQRSLLIAKLLFEHA